MSARIFALSALLALVALVALTVLVSACEPGQQGQIAIEVDAGPATPTFVGSDGIHIVQREQIQSGPTLAGSLEARDRAVLRAEVGGAVSSVAVELGERTKKGQVLARIDDKAARDAFLSARSAAASAEQDALIAQRQLERTKRLADAGALSPRDLEVAQSGVTTSQAQLADAKARLASSAQTLADAVVRAPFAGVVSERSVNAGDIVAPGTPLFSLIDPSTMRLTATVASDEIETVAVGKPVTFTVRGYGEQIWIGLIERVAPAADPMTRQITVLVAIPNAGGRLIAGLFAEGHVATEARLALVVPEAAVDESAGGARVMTVHDGRVREVAVTLGMRDRQSERVEVTSGLEPGDIVLVGGARALPPGTLVELEAAPSGAPVGR